MKQYSKNKIAIGVVVSLVLAFGVWYFMYMQSLVATSSLDGAPMDTPKQVVISGMRVCLPHKGDGPHTLECALGLRADDGSYYALETSMLPAEGVPMSGYVTAEGILVPIEAISTDFWSRYDIRGIIAASSLVLSGETHFFSCTEGKGIEATFAENRVYLQLSDGRGLWLPQTISASGARYAAADENFVFWNKGNTAFVTEGSEGKETFSGCVTE